MDTLLWVLIALGTVGLLCTFAYAAYLRRHPESPPDPKRTGMRVGIPSGVTGASARYPCRTFSTDASDVRLPGEARNG
ncbi:hypothetical protein GCM10009846_22740 [Agrococcus versicolor]|uniref:Uncharacterized protein n=1 Tax=Agrococcus versicolor TaxID=501482 RepID=A0ABP5ML75_9MICO